jgi:multiple sugar transport system permease protein
MQIAQYVILVLLGLLFITPLLWMFLASVDTSAIQTLRIPNELSLENYLFVLGSDSLRRSFITGLLMSGAQTLIVVIVCILAAYPLSRLQLSYRKSAMMTILFMTSLPMTVVMVPVFQLFLFLRFLDSQIAVVLFMAGTALPYGIWMMKNFMDSVPIDLEESAWVDGASTWQTIRKIVAPLMVPGILTVAIFTFSGSWGNFFVPFILLTSQEKLPASVTIFQFFGNFGLVNYGRLAAFSVLYTLPVIILYGLSQRFMSQGFSMGGATKG